MSTNLEIKLYNNPLPYYGYPSLGSNYLPNWLVDERIARFIRNNPASKDPLEKYLIAIQSFFAEKNIITKSVQLNYDSINNNFYVYMDDLFSSKNITLTLISSTDLNTGENVTNIQQPTFDYNSNSGIFYIYPDNIAYGSYQNLFILTSEISTNSHIALNYTLVNYT